MSAFTCLIQQKHAETYGDAPTSKSPHNSFSNLSSNCFDYFISLKRLSFKNLNPFSNQHTAKCKFWLAFILIYQGVHFCTKVCNLQLRTVRVVIQPESSGWLSLYSEYCEVTSLFMSVDVQIQQIMFRSVVQTCYPALPLPVHY